MIFTQRSIRIPKDPAKEYLLYGFESKDGVVVPPHGQPMRFHGDTLLWILPAGGTGAALRIDCGAYLVKRQIGGCVLIEFTGGYEKREYPARPVCDFHGRVMRLEMPDGDRFERAYARFYWDNLLPEVAERTFLRKKRDIRDGYVLSTLNKRAYAGTYPAVDHEFHMKGRFAVGGTFEMGLIRRMIELQFKIMREDKTGQSKNVCAVQQNRRREYDVWRFSLDKKRRAQMFRVTANIEITEGVYNYYCLSKDLNFLKTHIGALERNCSYIEKFITPDGLIDSHVYYEDQVIKDGYVTQAQCFAVNGFRLMAKIEDLLCRTAQAEKYASLARVLGGAVGRDFPKGYWNPETGRFIDWIDADGQAHDRVHLLANRLPWLFGLANLEQQKKCAEALERHRGVFEKFPSFVAAKIEDYTDAEIGSGGPYDLCAAGRYWCWDAEFLAFRRDGDRLLKQLLQVVAQAEKDGFLMGERYDMNYIYYNEGEDGGRDWHGASMYYEYPNVFLYVFICLYLGVRRGFDCDLVVDPLTRTPCAVTLESYGLSYRIGKGDIELANIGERRLSLDLRFLKERILLESGEKKTFRFLEAQQGLWD